MCYIEVDDPSTVWSHTQQRARKPHQCAVCLRVIYEGERYTRHFSVYEGEITSEKVCAWCQMARKAFVDAHDAEYAPSFFVQCLLDCIADGDEESEQKWKPMLNEILERRASRKKPQIIGAKSCSQ